MLVMHCCWLLGVKTLVFGRRHQQAEEAQAVLPGENRQIIWGQQRKVDIAAQLGSAGTCGVMRSGQRYSLQVLAPTRHLKLVVLLTWALAPGYCWEMRLDY